ncbi:glutathione hydrolase 7-like isoform X2 [Pagrus major]|uniref:glutathione hydrolase 7-like isoform X2 n=1 Tax=Pagrus major TaxID=143350 RepID=UPI003CC89A01
MDVSPETKLNQQFTRGYKSFAGSTQLADGSSPSDFTWDLNKNYDFSHLPKEIPLKQLVSGSPYVSHRSLSDLKQTDEDGPRQDKRVCVVFFTFAIGVTVALILHIYIMGSLAFVKGVSASDHKLCTALSQRVLHDGGSSVDAAIAAALCLGVVHPHASGIGGGGVMMVHDIKKNETRVINFQGTAPKTLKEEMLQNVSEVKAGLQVGVPGMLRGLHHAHSLYGRFSWEDVVTRAAAVAKEGFNVSFSLAEAITKVKGERLSQRFMDMFLPGGQALRPGSFVRMPGLAGVMEAGLWNFYEGNFSQEMEDEVRANGGVLSRDDISNYNVQVEQPVEGLYNEFITWVPPPPSAGAALISALNLLEGFHLTENNNTENQTYQRIAEALKAALAMASGLGDPKYNPSVTELLSDMLSKSQTEALHQRVKYSTVRSLQTELMAGQVAVMGPDDIMVSLASSLSRPFGSRMVTRSGVILNSLILDFSWPNKTHGQLFTNQVLIRALSLHEEKNDRLSLTRLHPKLQPSRLLADSKFPEEGVQFLDERGHKVQGVKTNSAVQGVMRNKDTITAIVLPQLSDGLL